MEGSQVSPVCTYGGINIHVKMSVERWWKDTDRGKRRTATLSTRNLTSADLGMNPSLLSERPGTDRGTACEARNSSKVCIKVQFVPHREQPVSIIETILLRNVALGNKLFLSRESKETHTLSGGIK